VSNSLAAPIAAIGVEPHGHVETFATHALPDDGVKAVYGPLVSLTAPFERDRVMTTFTQLRYPGALYNTTYAEDINDSGLVVGTVFR